MTSNGECHTMKSTPTLCTWTRTFCGQEGLLCTPHLLRQQVPLGNPHGVYQVNSQLVVLEVGREITGDGSTARTTQLHFTLALAVHPPLPLDNGLGWPQLALCLLVRLGLHQGCPTSMRQSEDLTGAPASSKGMPFSVLSLY